MGVLRRLAMAATGIGPIERTADRLMDEIDERSRQGLDEFIVSFSQNDVGIRNRLDTATPVIVGLLQDAGHIVLDAIAPQGGWSGTIQLRIRPNMRQSYPEQARQPTEDPALVELRAAFALADKEPPEGNAGASMSSMEIEDVVTWMRDAYDRGMLRAVWERRLALGHDINLDQLPRSTAFWLNATPAIAALRLGLKDHPAVAMFCGRAEDFEDRSVPEQAAAVAEFNRLYFG